MKIAMVIDRYDALNNGTTMTAYRFTKMLEKRGHEVRVVASGESAPGKYIVRESNYPLATKIAAKQGFTFAHPEEDVFKKAFQDVDLVHFLLPLHFERKGVKVAKKMGVPCCAAFHLQPENITYNIHLGKVQPVTNGIYKFYRDAFYKNFDHIHCPSKFIADELKNNGYQAKLHVISNGVDNDFVPMHIKRTDNKFNVLMVGRLSPEKRQNVLIDAVSLSKYADKIQLYLAGKGPCEKALFQQGKKLKNQPIFGFYSKPQLIQLMNSCDLYVHASYIEIEAISCMEAFSCGLVPIICNSPKSATVQFALDERSLFEPDNAEDLAKKIDYWIEHPEEKAMISDLYAEQGDHYRVEQSVIKAEEMFREVIEEGKRNSSVNGL